MARANETRPDPMAGGKGRSDEVDQSKGIFPATGPHPAGAELRAPGSLGGGPYEESGRGGPFVGGEGVGEESEPPEGEGAESAATDAERSEGGPPTQRAATERHGAATNERDETTAAPNVEGGKR